MQRRGTRSNFPPAHDFGQPPVHDERLAVLADHDVARFQIPVQHSPTVCVFHRIADVDEAAEKLANLQLPRARVLSIRIVSTVKLFDGLSQAVPFDEPHCVKRSPVRTLTKGIHRHDSRMLKTARNLGLKHKPFTGCRIVTVLNQDLFQRHFPVQLQVQGDRDLPQASFGMRSQNSESPCQSLRFVQFRWQAHVIRSRVPGASQIGGQICVCRALQTGPVQGCHTRGGQAGLVVTLMLLQELGNQPGQFVVFLARERTRFNQDLAEVPRLIPNPCVKSREQLLPSNGVGLQRADDE